MAPNAVSNSNDNNNDGWTYVPPRKKPSHRSQGHTPHHPHHLPGANTTTSSSSSTAVSLSSLTKDYHARRREWQSSDSRRTLLALLDRILDVGSGDGRFTRALCVGTGSVVRDNVECQRRSMRQLVVFVDVVGYLGVGRGGMGDGGEVRSRSRSRSRIRRKGVYAQDPAYTAVDREFWETLGVEVLNVKGQEGREGQEGSWGRLGKEVLGENTLLFEPFVGLAGEMVREMVERDVGLYIGSSIPGLQENAERWERWEQKRRKQVSRVANADPTDVETRRKAEAGLWATRFCEGREMYRFPRFDADPGVFEGLGIYWKEEKEEE